MKKIFIIIVLLFTATTYSQYVVIDTLNNVVTLTAQQQRDIDNILNGMVFGQDITAVRNQLEALDAEFNAYKLTTDGRLDKLEDGSTIVYPTAPTELVVTGVSTSQIDLTWKGGFRNYSAVIIWRSTTGSNYSELLRQAGSDSTYSDTGLNEGTPYWYYVSFYDSTYQLASNYSNSDSGLTLVTPPSGGGAAYDYYVTVDADGSGDGSEANPWTIYQAVAGATAGDTVLIQKGEYILPDVSGGNLVFNNSGTYGNPIVFVGIRADEPEDTAGGTNNTLIRGDWNVSSGALSISGAYITLKNMIIRQRYTDRVTTVINVSSSGHHFTMDSVVVQYPENNSSGSYHTLITYADYTTLRYCYFYRGCRTIIWVRASYPNTCDNFLMEYCTIDGFSNHYGIQIMPSTSSTPISKITNSIVRNCVFKNGTYQAVMYIRNVLNCKIYNNIFVNNSGAYGAFDFLATDGANSEASYNTSSLIANNTIYATATSGTYYMLLNSGSNMNGWTIKNNLSYFTYGVSPYRNYCYLNTTPSGQDYSIDYNMLYAVNNSINNMVVSWQQPNSCTTSSYSWANWKARGFDTHSIIDTNPNFVNPTTNQDTWDFHLGSQRAGTDLSSWGITTDYDGVTRTNWTMGAFEYVP